MGAKAINLGEYYCKKVNFCPFKKGIFPFKNSGLLNTSNSVTTDLAQRLFVEKFSWFKLKPKRHETSFFYLAFAFSFALPWFTRVKCKRKRKCKGNEMKNFHFLRWRFVCICVVVVHTCICLCLRLRCSCESACTASE